MGDKTDFNDMAAECGIDVVARAIDAALLVDGSAYVQKGANGTQALPAQAPRVTLTCAADIIPEAINWLWDGWLAAGDRKSVV